MAYIGSRPADKALQTSDIEDSAVTSAKIADGTIASGDLASGVGGKILQVVSTTKTDTFTASSLSGNGTVDITGLSVAITPAATSSKILIIYSVHGSQDQGSRQSNFALRLLRGSTDISLADAASNRFRVTSVFTVNASDDDNATSNIAGNFLDSPSTTDATTYKLQIANISSSSRNIHINRTNGDADDSNYRPRSTSTITAIEVAV